MKIKLENTVTGQMITLGLRGEYLIQEKDFGAAPGHHNTTQYVNLIGSHINGTSLGVRDISITGIICIKKSQSMAERKKQLNRLINPRHDLKLYYNDYVIVVRPDSSVKYSNNKYDNGKTICKFLIQGTAFQPAFKRINEEVFYYSQANKVSLFPLIIPKTKGICFGKLSTISTKNVFNDGDIETGFIVRFVADEGEVTNPKMTNQKTGKFIEVIIQMLKGDIVELSTISGNKYAKFIRGSTETDIFKLITKKSTMSMTLNTGYNHIAITAARNAANLNNIIKFTPLYLEVQE